MKRKKVLGEEACDKKIKFSSVKFKFGVLFICKKNGRLVWAEFEKKGVSPFSELKKRGYVLGEDEEALKDEISLLKRYFNGEKLDFSKIPVTFLFGTEMEKMVWKELMRIPYGKTVSYSYLAEKIGIHSAQRFVGNAVGKNPIPVIIPCHRVVRKDGTLGGFSAGLHVKKYLLTLESAFK